MVLDEEALEAMIRRQNEADSRAGNAQAQLTDQTDEFEVYERPSEDGPEQPERPPETEPEPPAMDAASSQEVLRAPEPAEPTQARPEATPRRVAEQTAQPDVLPTTHAPEPQAEPSTPTQPQAGAVVRIGLVHCRFNHEITDRMAETAVLRADEAGAEVTTKVTVAGVFDAPLAVQALALRDDIDAVVVVGTVIKGDTDHDVVITQATATNLQRVALDTGKPVGLGVTGPGMSWAEAEARIGNAAHAVDAVVAQVGVLRGA